MKRSKSSDATPVERSGGGSDSKKRVRFDVAPEDHPAREGAGFALRLVDSAGATVPDSPLHVDWTNDSQFELGRQFFVHRGSTGLGKHITRVSRQHIKITRTDGGKYVLEDVSANGTWLNNVKLGRGIPVKLPHNSIITLIYDEHEVPLLQFRFICSSQPSQRTLLPSSSQSSPSQRGGKAGEASDAHDEDDGSADERTPPVAHGGGARSNGAAAAAAAAAHENDWIGRNSVSISAGLVLLASALAASWANMN